MGVLDNGRVWQCNVLISDLYFGDPTKQNSITTGSTTGYNNRNIKSWKITDTMSANGDVAFGSTGSKALNLELFGLSSKSFGTGAIIGVMLSGVAAPKYWYFFVDTAKWTVDYGSTTRYSVSVTAYDAMYYASGKISSVALPSSIEALIESGKATITNCKTIAQYCIRHARYDLIRTRAGELYSETGLEKYRTYSNMLDSNLDDAYVSGTATMDWVCSDNVGKVTIGALPYSGEISITSAMTGRTLLGRMAAMAGKRAYCNNNSSANIGAIEFDDLISGSYSAISTGDVYDNGFVAEGKKSFQYFTNGTVSYGKKTSNGFSTMAINCPDMTQAKINSLGSAYKGTEYEIGSVKFRGDPTLISGMRLNAPDASGATHNMVCTKVVTCYDGGLYQQLYSEGKSDSDIEFEMNSASQKAEDIVDEGGGGGTSNLLYYSETENPNAATIAVDGTALTADASGIGITGDLSVTGDINCGGTLTYNQLVADSLTVSGASYLGGDVTIGNGKRITLSQTISSSGASITYNSSLSPLNYSGHDIVLSSTRTNIDGGNIYTANNKIVLYTLEPGNVYDFPPGYTEGEYGAYPQLFIEQTRSKNGVGVDDVPNMRLSFQGLTFARAEGYQKSAKGGIVIAREELNSTPPDRYSRLLIKFLDYNGSANKEYVLRWQDIEALLNLITP